MFTKEILVEARRRALRRGVWYSALDVVERGILSLASYILDSVQSNVLNAQLAKIIAKIRDACKSGFIKYLERFGMARVRVIQAQAFSFGYEGAKTLSNDFDFVRYLIFLDFNQPIGWGAFKK
jgi:hypothetical protein